MAPLPVHIFPARSSPNFLLGAILGALHGYSSLPAYWRDHLHQVDFFLFDPDTDTTAPLPVASSQSLSCLSGSSEPRWGIEGLHQNV